MKHVYLSFLILLIADALKAQVPDWAWLRTGSGSDEDRSRNMAIDNNGNIYITGSFASANAVFSGSTIANSGSAGSADYFLAKYNRAGDLQWVKRAQGADDDEGMAVATDAAGNIYVTGSFESQTITFGATTLTNAATTGVSDIFHVKYNPAGNVLWANSYGGTQVETGNSIVADAAGNTYLTGNFYSLSVLFGNFGVINSGASDAFVTKFNVNGTPLWSRQIGGGLTDNGKDIGVDGSGNVYVTGDYNSTSISSFSPAITNAGGFDIFMAKYDSAGNLLFGLRAGGADDEAANALVMNGSNYFIAGYFESNSLVLNAITLNNSASRNMFFAKYNSAGTAQWAMRAAADANSSPSDVAVDGAGNLYATGVFNMPALTFGSYTLNNGGGLDAFIVKYNNSNGSVMWAKNASSSGFEEAGAIRVSGTYVHLTGAYTSTLTLGNLSAPGTQNTNAFLTKLCNAPPPPISSTGNTVCAGSPGALSVTTPSGMVGTWFSQPSGGNALFTGSTYNAPSAGTYYVASNDTSGGCGIISNSRIAVTLSVFPAFNPSVSVSGNTISAAGPGSVVAWYNCVSGSTISGQSANNYVIDATGSYAVIMSMNGCRDTSSCESYSYNPGTNTVVVTTSLKEQETQNSFILFPNPGKGVFTIRTGTGGEYRVTDISGKVLGLMQLEAGENKTELNWLSAGLYFLYGPERQHYTKIIIDP